MLAQYCSSVLSTTLNSLVASLTSLKIWSTKSAKKRHLCASISAHSLHRYMILKKYLVSSLEHTKMLTKWKDTRYFPNVARSGLDFGMWLNEYFGFESWPLRQLSCWWVRSFVHRDRWLLSGVSLSFTSSVCLSVCSQLWMNKGLCTTRGRHHNAQCYLFQFLFWLFDRIIETFLHKMAYEGIFFSVHKTSQDEPRGQIFL